MEKILLRVIITTGACCLSAKYIYVQEPLIWADAQGYCRNYYTDLLPVSNALVEGVLRDSVDRYDSGWIGVYWNQTTNTWRWSGGNNVTFWKDLYTYTSSPDKLEEPYPLVNNIYWTRYKWFFRFGMIPENFFCLSLTVVQEEKSWEEAQEVCRRNDSDLTSLLSVTENLLAKNQISQTNITEPVWIGLRYLGDGWMWVNGDPLEHGGWSPGGDQDLQCPTKKRCGALTKGGEWENWDCQEKLSFICG